MLSRTEIERIAAATHELRPDWPISSLVTWLRTDHAHRAYRDVATALAWIACDPATRTPKRLNEPGPWWNAVATAGGADDMTGWPRCEVEGHEHELAHACRTCRSERIARPDDAPAPDPTPPDDEGLGSAILRAAMRQHGIPFTERTAR